MLFGKSEKSSHILQQNTIVESLNMQTEKIEDEECYAAVNKNECILN